ARFQRIIEDDSEDSQPLKAQAYLLLADLHIQSREWRDAHAALDIINKNQSLFSRDRNKRAEATYKLGLVLEELGDRAAASQAYLAVVATYNSLYDWTTQAWERYMQISLADIEAMETNDPLSIALKRKRELALYKLTYKNVYSWQSLDEKTQAPSGALARLRRRVEDITNELKITPQEEQTILQELALPAKKA